MVLPKKMNIGQEFEKNQKMVSRFHYPAVYICWAYETRLKPLVPIFSVHAFSIFLEILILIWLIRRITLLCSVISRYLLCSRFFVPDAIIF
jgi:hypothetical protein